MSIASLLFLSMQLFAANPPPALKPVIVQPKTEDPYIAKSWHLNTIEAFEAWRVTQGDPSIIVAIVDSGIDYNHPDISRNVHRNLKEWPLDGIDSDGNGFIDDVIGWDFVKPTFLPFDRSGHGTFMASIIASPYENGEGSAGVCPSCTLMPVRFINGEGLGDTEDAIEGIYYAAKHGAKVINISFAGEGYDKELEKAIFYAGTKDAVVVVSASNDNENLDKVNTYPAKFQMPHMLTVAASTENGGLMEGSNWGKNTVSLSAPGEEIFGIWNGKYDTGSGTSQAAAVASGVVGLARAANPDLKADQIVRLIRQSVKKVSAQKNVSQTGGIINAKTAVQISNRLKTFEDHSQLKDVSLTVGSP